MSYEIGFIPSDSKFEEVQWLPKMAKQQSEYTDIKRHCKQKAVCKCKGTNMYTSYTMYISF